MRNTLSPGLIGVALALAILPFHLWLGYLQSVQLAALLLATVGAIYIGFALALGTMRQMASEACAATLFFGAAAAGIWWHAWVIPAAYVLHGIWDTLHHRSTRSLTPLPRWYPPFCAVYDWVYAAGLLLIWHG